VQSTIRAHLRKAVAAGLLFSASAHAQVVVDTCGQSVDGDAALTADLDCSAAPLPSVTFTKNATFSLGGHTLTGQVSSVAARLEVVGPGTITGPGYGIAAEGNNQHGGNLIVRSVDVSGNTLDGVVAFGGGQTASAQVIDSTVGSNGRRGVWVLATATCPKQGCDPLAKVRVEGSTIVGNGLSGIEASSIDVRSSTITSNALHGIYVYLKAANRKLRLSDSDVSDNGDAGIFVDSYARAKLLIRSSSISRNPTGIRDVATSPVRMRLKGVSLDENDTGIRTAENSTIEPPKKVLMLDSSITNSRYSAIVAVDNTVFVTLKRSTLSGSATAPACGVTEACADLDTDTLPLVKAGTACETSHVRDSGIPGTSWGVCAND